MGRTGISRALVALAAAYALALHGLLPVLSLVAVAPGAAVVCTPAHSGAASPPLPGSDCPCAAGCGMPCHCANASAPPPPTVVATAYRAASVLPAGASAPADPAARLAPYRPRAPPRPGHAS
jgi:hypothetical protein